MIIILVMMIFLATVLFLDWCETQDQDVDLLEGFCDDDKW